jgi:hypothetical protein
VVDHSPSKHEVLGSIPRTAKKKNKAQNAMPKIIISHGTHIQCKVRFVLVLPICRRFVGKQEFTGQRRRWSRYPRY